MSDASNTSDDDEFQASSEDIEIKPWDLPYWSGGPKKEKEKPEEVEDPTIDIGQQTHVPDGDYKLSTANYLNA